VVRHGTPILITGSYDSINTTGGHKLYLNGTLENSMDVVDRIGVNTSALRIGRQKLSFSGRHFKGQISEVIIYNRVLSDQEREDVERYLADKYQITIS
jgi:hypothetical protein